MPVVNPQPSPTYQRHSPEETVLYKIVQEYLETFLKLAEAECGRPLPDFVEKEFREYLKCGILAHGFLRVRCLSCCHERFVAFSCKRRGFCPSCGGRRMSESAIHLVDEVLPQNPIRQWVLSFPIQLRLLLSVRPKTMTEILNISTQVISKYLQKKSGIKKSKTGAVTLIQRFGGSINLNPHFHQIFLDGVFEIDEMGKPMAFHHTKAPTNDEMKEVLEKIIQKTIKLLEKQGIIKRDEEDKLQLNLEEDDALAKLQQGAVTYRFAIGPNKGKKALTLKVVTEDHSGVRNLVANHSGFSLEAGVAFRGFQRDKIEKLCRYIARPAVANERLSLNSQGQVVYHLKKPYSDGTTHIVMTPMELMEKLAALVPRPRIHLTRFAGVFAPNYKYRAMIVPKPKEHKTEDGSSCVEKELPQAPSKSRIEWAKLLKMVFKLDVEHCENCGGQMKIISAIDSPELIKKILIHLKLPHSPPKLAPARAPPEGFGDDFS